MLKSKILAGILFALVLTNLISLKQNADLFAKIRDVDPEFVQEGVASWYGPGFQGRKTANGERFDTYEMTAAHKTLPFNTKLKITYIKTGISAIVRVNDRGPFIPGRDVDLSKGCAQKIGLIQEGVGDVMIEILDGSTPVAVVPPKPVIPNNPMPTADIKDTIRSESFTYKINIRRDSIQGYTIQLGAFTKSENAWKFTEELNKKGFLDTYLYKSVTDNQQYYRVLYGDYNSGAAAKQLQEQLQSAGYKGILVVP